MKKCGCCEMIFEDFYPFCPRCCKNDKITEMNKHIANNIIKISLFIILSTILEEI